MPRTKKELIAEMNELHKQLQDLPDPPHSNPTCSANHWELANGSTIEFRDPQPTCYHCGTETKTSINGMILCHECYRELFTYLSQACKVAKLKAKEWNDGNL